MNFSLHPGAFFPQTVRRSAENQGLFDPWRFFGFFCLQHFVRISGIFTARKFLGCQLLGFQLNSLLLQTSPGRVLS